MIQTSVRLEWSRSPARAACRRHSLRLARVLIAVALVWRMPATAAPADARVDPLRVLLEAEDSEAARIDLQRELRRSGASPCARLAGFGGDRNLQVREHAVRALSDAGCADFDAYRPYLGDPSPWVIRAVLQAVERRLIAEALPFLTDSLADKRTILSDEGSFTIGSLAHRALRVVTCQSFHFDPAASPERRADAIAQWRSWYAAHRSEPRDAWVAEGIALARDYLGRDYAPHRREGIELLTLIGSPAIPSLRGAFRRSPEDLRATISCNPEEPPRVTEQVPCVLLVTNASKRRLLLAPADLVVRLVRVDRDSGSAGGTARRSLKAGRSSAADRDAGAEREAAADRISAPALSEIAARVLDLAPGEVLRRDVAVGPVGGAGRYEVHAILPDLASSLSVFEARPPSVGKGAAEPRTRQTPGLPSIEATTVVRFEQ